MSEYQFGERHITGAHHTPITDLRDDVVWPVNGDATTRAQHPTQGNLWGAPGVARNDDNEPHYAVPLVGTTEERLATVETLLERARHVFRVNEYIRSGRIY